jgi:hypothetical protein
MRTTEAVGAIGCTFRQLDHLTRLGIIQGFTPGSGNSRSWPEPLVVRLALAYHIAQAVPRANRHLTPFPEIVRTVLDRAVPPPPRRGYGVMSVDPMTMTWSATWADLRREIDEAGAAVVVSFDLDDLVGEYVDLDQLSYCYA